MAFRNPFQHLCFPKVHRLSAQFSPRPPNPHPLLLRQRDPKILPQSLHPFLLRPANPQNPSPPPRILLHLPINQHDLPTDLIPFSQKLNHEYRLQLKAVRVRTRKVVHDLEVRLREFEFWKAVERVPRLCQAITVLIDPKFAAFVHLFGDGVVDETDILGADVVCDGAFEEGKRGCCSVAAEADVDHVFCAIGEGYDVEYMYPAEY